MSKFTLSSLTLFVIILPQDQRAALKEKWITLTEEEKIPYEKKMREHMVKQDLMRECITDALRKEEGGNCSRSYASLAKVSKMPLIFLNSTSHHITSYRDARPQGTGAIGQRLSTGCSQSQTIVFIPNAYAQG